MKGDIAKMPTKSNRKSKIQVKPVTPNLANATPGFLLDEIGRLRREIKDLQKQEGMYKEALYARLEPDEQTIEGEQYVGLVEEVVQHRFSQSLAKEKLDPEDFEECFQETSYKKLSVTKRNGG